MDIRQYLYFSLAARSFGEPELGEMLQEFRDANAKHDITGMLIYVGNYFIQHIEGPNAEIGQLAENIRNDDRLRDFTCLIDNRVSERIYPDWCMGFEMISEHAVQDMPGMVNLKTVADLDRFDLDQHAAWQIMKNFYKDNKNVPKFSPTSG